MSTIPALASEQTHMRCALAAAAAAAKAGEVPVGAVLVDAAGSIIASAHNQCQRGVDPLAHAEVLVIGAAAQKLQQRYLADYTLVVTLEPCVLCAGAILAARVGRVIFGAWDEKAGAAGSVYDLLRDGRLPHRSPQVISGVLAAESQQLLTDFFAAKR